MTKIILSCICLLPLIGCTNSVPLVLETLGANGQIVETMTDRVTTASLAKEQAVMRTLRHRDTQYRKAYAKSGFKMDWQAVNKVMTVSIDGKPIIIKTTDYLPVVSYRESPKFNNPLPTRPSNHPVWSWLSSSVREISRAVLFGYGIDKFGDIMEAGLAAAGSTFHGDVFADQSFNDTTTTGDYNKLFSQSTITTTDILPAAE